MAFAGNILDVFTNKSISSNINSHVYCGPIAGLRLYSLDHVYHHISEGASVTLVLDHSIGQTRVLVLFKGMAIGFVPVAPDGNLVRLLQRRFELQATITKLEKQKYLAPERIELSITA